MKRWFCIVSLVIAITLGMSFTSESYFGDSVTDKKHFSLGIAGQGLDQTTSLTALFPFKYGWLGLHGARQTANDELVSEIGNIHLQGIYDIGSVNLEAYIEAISDYKRGIKNSIGSGYFLRPPKLRWNDILFSFGIGNWTEQRNNDTEIDRDAADSEARIGWLSFVSAALDIRRAHISAVVRYKPTIDFDHTIWEFSSAINYPINKKLLIGFTNKSILEDDEIHTAYQFVLTYTPGEGE